ncbi:YcdB/YcdC domain-containing protein [Bacillus spizizenii]|uniref:YcdB/YcdC domain-containing protein n=1 Tax=Bacillus spizizenii TaxID=96241 RepID=UPI0002D69C3A|nr:YcdB/YcdC domain-containing protein [Bacillus spizizenii]
MVNKQLKKKAQEIGNVPPHYELEIEDYEQNQKKKGQAYFIWKDPEDSEKRITVELRHDGALLTFSTTACSETDKKLPDAELKLMALQFAAANHPGTFMKFHFQGKEERGHHIRFIYTKMELELPLPNSGFLIDITRSGQIVHFLYYGEGYKAEVPKEFVAKEKVLSHYLNTMSLQLMYDVIDGEQAPRLVYEPILPGYSYPADVDEIVPDQHIADERIENGAPLPPLQNREETNIYAMLGLTSDMQKVSEKDFGEEIGSTWRKGTAPERKDLSIGSYFETRNKNTIKILTDKKTGKLKAALSFLDQRNNRRCSTEECQRIALQFLYALYPRAAEFFRANPVRIDERGRVRNHFSVWYKGVPLRFGAARIIVNPEKGMIDAFMAPDIDPEKLETINHRPDVSAEEAKETFLGAFDVKLEWQPDFTAGSDQHYKLVYKPVYPSYIDAHIRKKKRL